jgi:hypothetical protein
MEPVAATAEGTKAHDAESMSPAQLAQANVQTAQNAQPVHGPNPIGQIKSLVGNVSVIRADGTRQTLNNGDRVYEGDKIETAKNAKVGIVFADGSTFCVAEDASFTIDTLVYDPKAGSGKSVIDIATGVFSYVSGEIAKTNESAATITTPVATIGIRGTTIVGKAGPEGSQNTITLLRDSDGSLGEVAIVTLGGQRILTSPLELYSLFSRNADPGISQTIDQQEFDRIFGRDVLIIPRQPAQDIDPAQGNDPPSQETSFKIEVVEQIDIDGAVRDLSALRPLANLFRNFDALEDDGSLNDEEVEDILTGFDERITFGNNGNKNNVGPDAPIVDANDVDGAPGSTIQLDLSAELFDETESLEVMITGVPSGATFEVDSVSVGTDNGGGEWDLTGVNLSQLDLNLSGASSFTGNANMTLIATSSTDTDSASSEVEFTASIGSAPNLIIGNSGNNNLTGTSSADVIHGRNGDDVITADLGDDDAHGGRGDDTLSGSDGNDKLYGGYGNDILDGEDDDDTLEGGPGTDTLTGGANADTFVLDSSSNDVITDFSTGDQDILDLQDLFTVPLAGDINDFLTIFDNGSDTTVNVSSTAGGEQTQVATLQGFTGHGLSVNDLVSGEHILFTETS